LLLKKRGTSLS